MTQRPDNRAWLLMLPAMSDLYAALGRSLLFSALVVLVQFPLGIAIALMIPRGRLAGSLVLMLVAIPLVVPWNLIPMIWLNLLHPTYGTVAQMSGTGHRWWRCWPSPG